MVLGALGALAVWLLPSWFPVAAAVQADRQDTLAELMHHGYEDAYRQFIEPVVGASGVQLVQLPLQSPDGTDDGKGEADLKMGLYLRDLEP